MKYNLLLDLDDTIYPEKEYVLNGYINLLKELLKKHKIKDCIIENKIYTFGCKQFLLENYSAEIKEKKVFEKIKLLFELKDIDEEILEKRISFFYNYHLLPLFPFEDFVDFLNKNKEYINKTVILTDGDYVKQTFKLSNLKPNLPAWFNPVLIINNSKNPKPYCLEKYLDIFDELEKDLYLSRDELIKYPCKNLIVIGDRYKDILFFKDNIAVKKFIYINPDRLYPIEKVDETVNCQFIWNYLAIDLTKESLI